jgi:hypothetical protein
VETEKAKKKGFWGRVFGGGNDEKKDDNNKDKKPAATSGTNHSQPQ